MFPFKVSCFCPELGTDPREARDGGEPLIVSGAL